MILSSPTRRPANDTGQASIELVAMMPAMVLGAMIVLQLAITAYSLHLADGAAEAGALALATGTDSEGAVLAALPGWARDDVDVSSGGGHVEVAVRPPAPLRALSEALEMSASAWAMGAADDG